MTKTPQNRDELLAVIKQVLSNNEQLRCEGANPAAIKGSMQHKHQLMCSAMMSNSVLKKATAWMMFGPSMMRGGVWDAVEHWVVELGLDALDVWRTILDERGGAIAEAVARECSTSVTDLNRHFAYLATKEMASMPEQAGC